MITAGMRDYSAITVNLSSNAARDQRMRALVDVLWDAFSNRGYSWVGFYLPEQTESGHTRLILGHCRDKPACSPIGLHGVCGQCLLSREVRIVRDVSELGANYIACDPRDRSEIVVPCIDPAGTVFAVLDIDSHEIGAFDQNDADGLRYLLWRAGLSA